MTIEFPKDIELQLEGEARRHGLEPEAYVKKIVIDRLPTSGQRAESVRALFAAWDAEDPIVDEADRQQRIRELEEFKANMNRNRLEMEGPNSRVPFP